MGGLFDGMLSRHTAAQTDQGFIEDAALAKKFDEEFKAACADAAKTNKDAKVMVEASKGKRAKHSEAIAENGAQASGTSSASGPGPSCGSRSSGQQQATGRSSGHQQAAGKTQVKHG